MGGIYNEDIAIAIIDEIENPQFTELELHWTNWLKAMESVGLRRDLS